MSRTYIFLLGLAAAAVSLTGASLAVLGLARIFSGAAVSVMIMAAALELGKVVSAIFLYSHWKTLHSVMRIYLSVAIVILMGTTSMGIFGYLSHTYQHASSELRDAMNNLVYFNNEDRKVQEEIARLHAEVNQIPESRVHMRRDLQEKIAPHVDQLTRKSIALMIKLRQEYSKKLRYQPRVLPVVWVAQFVNKEMDRVASWLIMFFVLIFEPFAVCLVLATSSAVKARHKPEAVAMPARSAA